MDLIASCGEKAYCKQIPVYLSCVMPVAMLSRPFKLSNNKTAITPNPTLLQKPAGLYLRHCRTCWWLSQLYHRWSHWKWVGNDALLSQCKIWCNCSPNCSSVGRLNHSDVNPYFVQGRAVARPALLCFISKGNRIFGDRRSHLTWSNILLIGAVMLR